MPISEFDLIRRFFRRERPFRSDVILGIGDDAALLQPPPGQHIAITTDTLVLGQHFSEDTPPADIGHKSLAVNLSDLAAMGAEPRWVLLALTLPTVSEIWLEEFARGFFSLLDGFACQLVGGNLSCGPLSITLQAIGVVPFSQALCRSGAQLGDHIYVTGSLGDAGLALAYLQGTVVSARPSEREMQALIQRLNCPQPRIDAGLALRGLASSAIDISDGLAADLGHILAASQVAAVVSVDDLPLSESLRALPAAQRWQLALSAGEDYELCFTVAASHKAALQACFQCVSCRYTYIGTIERGSGLSLRRRDGSLFHLPRSGFRHF